MQYFGYHLLVLLLWFLDHFYRVLKLSYCYYAKDNVKKPREWGWARGLDPGGYWG